MMVSAQCICKNTIGCKKQPVELTLVDRMRNHFPVKNNCRECYNVIYNSLPLSLADQWSSGAYTFASQCKIKFYYRNTNADGRGISVYKELARQERRRQNSKIQHAVIIKEALSKKRSAVY